ncbi:hypothetical protein [Parendozoicomonas haliclonae]|uniref:Uncharacterized protein n=1 Tax=Parendozoicomonas haliclonae TaxID=1960125 RepID=A0A1X7AJI8_9GAMM|nr:hypothetical protein [Parendozoicomonas haliclonae]SMA45919.1 hypothetical protein EHSB41UT_02036 [Parendozoicomonas haliclonae]
MNATKLFAISLIASAISASALAEAPNDDFVVKTELPDIIEVEVKKPTVVLGTPDRGGRLTGDTGVSIKMRGASDENKRPYIIKMNQEIDGPYQMVHKKNKDKMPLEISFHPGLVEESGIALSNGTEIKHKRFKTNNGLNSNLDHNTYLTFMVLKGNHENAYPGVYTSNLTLWVTAK